MSLHVFHFFNETIKALNFFIESKVYYTNVKRIKRYYNIESSNKSKTNFIFRNLQVLVDHNIIERYERNRRVYSYKLPKEIIVVHYSKGSVSHIEIKKIIKKVIEN